MTAQTIFYDLDGLPIGLEQAQELLHDYDARVIAETQIDTMFGTLWIATLHSVIDQHSPIYEEHVPVLFATRVHGVCERRHLVGMRGQYATVDKALDGHMAVLRELIEELAGDVLVVLQKTLKRTRAA